MAPKTRSSRHSLQARTATLALLFAIALAGCEDKRRHQASEELEFPVVAPAVSNDASPQDTAIALLKALKHLQEIRAKGFGDSATNKEKYDQAMGAVAALMDKESIYQNVVIHRAPSVPLDITRDAAVRLIAESWTSEVAHYSEGVDFASASTTILPKGQKIRGTFLHLTKSGETIRENERTREFEEAIVQIIAENPDERAKLAAIEADPGLAAKKAAAAATDQPDKAYVDLVRAKAIEQGFNIPIDVTIVINLMKAPEGWRATSLKLEQPMPRLTTAQPVAPTPTVPAQPAS